MPPMRNRGRQMSIVDAAIAQLHPRSSLVLSDGIVAPSLRPRQACMPTSARDDRNDLESQTRIDENAQRHRISLNHFEQDNVPGDGNCMYWVVANLLWLVGDGMHRRERYHFSVLRHRVAERLRVRRLSGHHALAMYFRLIQDNTLLAGVEAEMQRLSYNGSYPNFAAEELTPEVEALYDDLVENYVDQVVLRDPHNDGKFGVWSNELELEVISELFGVVIFFYTTDNVPSAAASPSGAMDSRLRFIFYPNMPYMRALLSSEAAGNRWRANQHQFVGLPTPEDEAQRRAIQAQGGAVRWHVVLHRNHYYYARPSDDGQSIVPAAPPGNDCHAPPPPDAPLPQERQATPTQPYGKTIVRDPVTVQVTQQEHEQNLRRQRERERNGPLAAAAAAAERRASLSAAERRRLTQTPAQRIARESRGAGGSEAPMSQPAPQAPPPPAREASSDWMAGLSEREIEEALQAQEMYATRQSEGASEDRGGPSTCVYDAPSFTHSDEEMQQMRDDIKRIEQRLRDMGMDF